MTSIVLRSRGDRFSVRFSRRVPVLVVGSVLAIVTVTAIALYTGQRALEPAMVTRILLGDYDGASGFDVYTVLDSRLPRAVSAASAGFALGVSGAIFQRVTGNELGSPDVIGFTNGAAAGALVAIAFGLTGVIGVAGGAVIGGVVAAVAVFLLASRRGVEGYRLLLVGVAVGAVLSAASSYLLSRIELEDAMTAYRWTTGSLAGRDGTDAAIGLIGVALLVPAIVVLHRPLDRIGAGTELARSQGLGVARARATAAMVGTVAVAIGVSVAGPIAFVALAAPHIARLLTRSGGPLLGLSALVGSALLAAADVVAARLLSPQQLPTGIVTAVIGGVYVAWLLQRRIRRGHA